MRELGAFYESKQRAIHSYLRKHAYNKASVTDISRYTGLRNDEVQYIVDNDLNLTTEHGDHIKRHA